MKAHPEANALSTGAILSTYQRTRIESVALRLGLTPLAYLWEYPILPPGEQISLLEDMQHVGLDARIVKVASGGLDESFLWQNVADSVVYRRIEKSMKRFGMDGDGAVLGEGGEFETLVVDGPDKLFKGSIVVKEEARRVVREGGGSAWIKILDATVVMKKPKEILRQTCRVPDLLEARFKKAFDFLNYNSSHLTSVEPGTLTSEPNSSLALCKAVGSQDVLETVLYWTVTASNIPCHSLGAEAGDVADQIRQLLHRASLTTRDIISTVIVLRSMADFTSVNTVSLSKQSPNT
jgi:diphthine-ammonia ligase